MKKLKWKVKSPGVKKVQKIEVMTVEMLEKEKFIDPMRLIQLVFDFYTVPLE